MSTSSYRFADLHTAKIPPSAVYDLPPMMPDADIISTKIQPQGGPTYFPGSTVIFNLPASDLFVDTQRSYIAVKMAVDPNRRRARFSEGAHCIVSSVKISTQSGQVLEHLLNYNLRASALAGITVPADMRTGPLGISQGYNKSANPDLEERYYVIPMTLSGILGNSKLLPLKYTGGLRVEITLAQPDECLVRLPDGDANRAAIPPSYTVTYARYVLSACKFSDQQISIYDDAYRKSGLKIHGTSFDVSFLNWSSRNQSLTVSNRKSSIKDLMVVARLGTDVVSTADGVEKLYKYSTCILQSLWAQWAGKRYPSEAITADAAGAEFYQHAADATHHSLVGWRATPALWRPAGYNGTQDCSMVAMLELESAGKSGYISGLSSPNRQAQDIILDVEGAVNPHPQQDVHCFVHYDATWVFAATGEVTVVA